MHLKISAYSSGDKKQKKKIPVPQANAHRTH